MDLHGLHVNEAIQQLAVHISSLGGAPQAGPLAVIVGTGSHTKVRLPQLLLVPPECPDRHLRRAVDTVSRCSC